MKISLYTDTNIKNYQEVLAAFRWCMTTFGPPTDDKWSYGRDSEGFLGRTIINSPEEIEYFVFNNPEDALLFKLTF